MMRIIVGRLGLHHTHIAQTHSPPSPGEREEWSYRRNESRNRSDNGWDYGEGQQKRGS
jgi:hypothetical protein